jgi:hypothetical protein
MERQQQVRGGLGKRRDGGSVGDGREAWRCTEGVAVYRGEGRHAARERAEGPRKCGGGRSKRAGRVSGEGFSGLGFRTWDLGSVLFCERTSAVVAREPARVAQVVDVGVLVQKTVDRRGVVRGVVLKLHPETPQPTKPPRTKGNAGAPEEARQRHSSEAEQPYRAKREWRGEEARERGEPRKRVNVAVNCSDAAKRTRSSEGWTGTTAGGRETNWKRKG